MALCVFVSKWGDFNWEDVSEIYRMPNLPPPSKKTAKNKIYSTHFLILGINFWIQWLEPGSTVLLQCSPSPEIPRRALNTTRYIAHTICLPSTLRSIVGQRVIVINGQSPWQQWVISLVWWLWWWWRFFGRKAPFDRQTAGAPIYVLTLPYNKGTLVWDN